MSWPIKDGVYAAPPAWSSAGGLGNDLYDIFDPQENTEINAELADTTNGTLQKVVHNNPWILGYITDDADWFAGVGAGPDFYNLGINSNLGWLTAITSPVQSFVESTRFLNESFLYPDTLLLYKGAGHESLHGLLCYESMQPARLPLEEI